MVKLYYTKTSCGAASFIAAFIANVSIDAEEVNLAEHKTASGVDYYSINPKGNVPTLVLDDGSILNEGSAVLQCIADMVSGMSDCQFIVSTKDYSVQTVGPGNCRPTQRYQRTLPCPSCSELCRL